MKDINSKLEFIEHRAQGLSYRQIACEMGISRTTCAQWDRQLADKIEKRKTEIYDRIAEIYGVDKESRIKRICGTLEKINAGLADADFSKIPPERLLKLKLDYEKQLKIEQMELLTDCGLENGSTAEILSVCARIFDAQARGMISAHTAAGLLKSLANVSKAVDKWKDENPLADLSGEEPEL